MSEPNEETTAASEAAKAQAAANDLLKRAAPQGYQQEWVERLRVIDEAQEVETTGVLVFRLEDEWLAILAHVVSEVTPPALSHRIPRRSNDILLGLVNVNGEIHLEVSLKTLLKVEPSSQEVTVERKRAYPRLVVIGAQRNHYAFKVDEVLGVYQYENDALEAVPITVDKSWATFTQGIFDLEDKRVGLLDEGLLLHGLEQNLV